MKSRYWPLSGAVFCRLDMAFIVGRKRTIGSRFSVVAPEGFVVGTEPPVPLCEGGVLSVGAVLPVPAAGAWVGVCSRPDCGTAVFCCWLGGSVASPHHSAQPHATSANINPAAKTISTDMPVRPCLASVEFSITAGSSFPSMTVRSIRLIKQPRLMEIIPDRRRPLRHYVRL